METMKALVLPHGVKEQTDCQVRSFDLCGARHWCFEEKQ